MAHSFHNELEPLVGHIENLLRLKINKILLNDDYEANNAPVFARLVYCFNQLDCVTVINVYV